VTEDASQHLACKKCIYIFNPYTYLLRGFVVVSYTHKDTMNYNIPVVVKKKVMQFVAIPESALVEKSIEIFIGFIHRKLTYGAP
jgi:hypothetical protein